MERNEKTGAACNWLTKGRSLPVIDTVGGTGSFMTSAP